MELDRKPSSILSGVVNPVVVLFVSYGLINFYSLVSIFRTGKLEVDLQIFEANLTDVGFASLGLFSTLVIAWFAYKFALNFRRAHKEIEFGGRSGLFLAVLQISYVIYSISSGQNIAGVENSGDSTLKLVFAFLESDAIFIAVSIGLSSHRWFAVNSIIYLASTMLRGWMGGVLILAIIVFCRFYPMHINRKGIARILLLGFFVIAILPFFIEVKWAIRSGESISLALWKVVGANYISSIFESLSYVLNRLQHLGHVALLAGSSMEMNVAFKAGLFSPYWQDGLPQQLILKILGEDFYTLDRYMVSYYFDNSNLAANTNPGIAGWLFVLRHDVLFFLSYLLVITIPAYLFLIRYAGIKYLLLLSSFSVLYLWHGWVGAYINLLMYMIVFVLIKRIKIEAG